MFNKLFQFLLQCFSQFHGGRIEAEVKVYNVCMGDSQKKESCRIWIAQRMDRNTTVIISRDWLRPDPVIRPCQLKPKVRPTVRQESSPFTAQLSSYGDQSLVNDIPLRQY